MKTSTPAGSPMRKKLSMAQHYLSIEDNETEIETELKSRRKEIINKSTEVRRKSTAAPLLAGFSATQLAQHCKDCIKLSTENKINSKNAFSFLLIDVMAAMAKKNDSEINKNFQVASCTLDASVKIYGYRVDAVHSEVLKMAGGFRGKEVNENEYEGESEGDKAEDENSEQKPKPKKKKKKLTIVPPETLNAKSEAEVLLDAVPQQNLLNMKEDGNDLFLRIPKYNDNCVLSIDPDFPCWPYEDNKTIFPSYKKDEDDDTTELMSILNNMNVAIDEKLCPYYSNFEFGKDYDEDGESDYEMGTSQNSNQFEFDMNTSVNDIPLSDADISDSGQALNQRNRLEIPAGGYDSDQEIVIQAAPCQKRNQNINISDMKKRLTINDLEYSIFDEKVFKAWAGPTYWKVRPTLSKKTSEENKENEEVTKQVASKRTRKGKIKGMVGLFDVSEDILVKYLTCGDKSTLCKTTMLNWHPKNTTMPKDCKYKAKSLFTLFHLPSFEIKPRLEVDCEDYESQISENDSENFENEAEPEELDYCSSLIMKDDVDENCTQTDIDLKVNSPNVKDIDVETWDQQNMVAVPNKVEKIAVSTFKRKKHVDIKNLKRCIWNILTHPETSEKKNIEEVKVTKPVEFSELLKIYPNKVPNSLSSSLSAPLIFNALLHLTNEKCLILTQDKTNKLDFVVSQ